MWPVVCFDLFSWTLAVICSFEFLLQVTSSLGVRVLCVVLCKVVRVVFCDVVRVVSCNVVCRGWRRSVVLSQLREERVRVEVDLGYWLTRFSSFRKIYGINSLDMVLILIFVHIPEYSGEKTCSLRNIFSAGHWKHITYPTCYSSADSYIFCCHNYCPLCDVTFQKHQSKVSAGVRAV